MLRVSLSAIENVNSIHEVLNVNEDERWGEAKTPLQCAVENKDTVTVTEILYHEHRYHPNLREGLICLKKQLKSSTRQQTLILFYSLRN